MKSGNKDTFKAMGTTYEESQSHEFQDLQNNPKKSSVAKK